MVSTENRNLSINPYLLSSHLEEMCLSLFPWYHTPILTQPTAYLFCWLRFYMNFFLAVVLFQNWSPLSNCVGDIIFLKHFKIIHCIGAVVLEDNWLKTKRALTGQVAHTVQSPNWGKQLRRPKMMSWGLLLHPIKSHWCGYSVQQQDSFHARSRGQTVSKYLRIITV